MSSVLEAKAFDQMASQSRHLHGPIVDGLLLGGASVIAFIAIRLSNISSANAAILAIAMLLLANLVNHPHFAHSYQLFYSLRPTLTDANVPASYRRRWLVAAYWVPAVLALLLAFGAAQWQWDDRRWLGAMINLMGALVGWHYVKQGFGMAMLDASLKRRFWPTHTRRALLVNAYCCWAAAWAIANASPVGAAFWGVFQLKMQVPASLIWGFCTIAAITTVWSLRSAVSTVLEWRSKGASWTQIPLNGAFAYLVTIYLWTLFSWADPAYALVIPFFHSLQYMSVVWRYKWNALRNDVSARRNQMIRFVLTGLILGAAGFWLIPGVVDYLATGQIPFQSPTAFVAIACAWLFINLHHYFIDSVIWRKENALTKKHLFTNG